MVLLTGCTWDWPTYDECGNGVVEPGETCDGTAFAGGGGRCSDVTAFEHGELSCTKTCRLDTSACHQCGNDELEGPEPCDGSNLDGQTCQGLGFDEGTLTCRDDCSQYDWSACVGCGDGVIRTGEACDDGNFVSGDGCDADCQVEPGWTCEGAGPSVCKTHCDDEIAAGDEVCDGADLRDQTCQGLGFAGGDLGCQADCAGFVTSGCGGPGCGNGVVEGTEVCDDGVAADGDGCSTGCQVEPGWSCDGASPTTCTAICGDGLIVGGEVCDGANQGGTTCASLGFDGGTLACNGACSALETGSCWTCGDGACAAEKGETVAACDADCGWAQIATGDDNTCGIKRDGSAWCWGANYDGQLGAGSLEDMLMRPTRVLGLPGLAQQVAVGLDFVCAKLWDNTAWCWGRNHQGQVGVDTAGTSVPAPTQVLGLPGILQVSAGDEHACARDVLGAAWCWGNGAQGRLGVGTEDDHAAPVQVSGLSGVISISAGGTFSCAVVDSGTAKCWGDNTWGVLGTGNTTSSLTPVQVSGLTGAASIVANGYTVCAIRDDGTAACWGSNGTGELGDGTQDDRYAPVNVLNLTGVTSIDGGGLHTCATDGSGIAWCWGHDSDGQVGNGEEYLYAATSPVQVVDLTGVVQITAAFTHSLAIDSSGRAWGWGYGGFGVLGNGVNGGPKPTSPIPTLEP